MELLDEEELGCVTGGTAVSGPFITYTMREQESIGQIARRFGTTVPILMSINSVTNANDLKNLRTLLVPQN